MAKMLRFDDMARMALKRGVDQVADAVKVTLGPRGRNVIVHGPSGSPVLTNDGITIARQIELEDPYENLGAQLLREVAAKTQEIAGDGTTTATLLAQSMVSQGILAVTSGDNPVRLRRGIDRAVEQVVEALRSQAQPATDRASLLRVARVAAGGDDRLASCVAEILETVGPHGIVQVEEGRGVEDHVRWNRGLQLERGYLSPYFVTEPETMECVMENPWVLLCDDKLDSLAPLIPLLEAAAESNSALLLIADDVEGEALATLVMNRLRGVLDVAAVKAPGFGESRRAMLEDLAVATGGTVVAEDAGRSLDSLLPRDLGRCGRAVLTRDSATLLDGAGDREAIQERVQELETWLERASSEHDRVRLRRRIALLTGRIAILEVGGTTPLEVAERRGRAHDAISAAQAAMEEGVVSGGGVALLRAIGSLRDLGGGNHAERRGVEIVEEALRAPLQTIAENAGYDPAETLSRVQAESGDFGLDAETGLFGSLSEAGILDPLKVVRSALQNAASIGALILTTETLVAERPEDGEDRRKEA